MADIQIPYAQPGVASFELSDTYINPILLMGSHPAQSPAVSGEAGDDLLEFQVIGFDASGNIVPATYNADPELAIKAVGITTAAALTGERVLYWYAGHYNIDLLQFDATFTTTELGAAAFNGSPTPTNIRLDSRSLTA